MKGKQRLTSYETKQRRTPPENLTCAMELEQKKTFLIAGNNEIENRIEKKCGNSTTSAAKKILT